MPIDSPAAAESVPGRIPAFDGLDRAGLVRRREDESVTDLDAAGLDAARQDAAFVKPVDVLDREAQRLVVGQVRNFELVERLQHGRPRATRACLRCARRCCPRASRQIGMNTFGSTPMLLQPGAVLGFDLVEPRLAVILPGPFCSPAPRSGGCRAGSAGNRAAASSPARPHARRSAAAPLPRWPRR